MSMNNFKLDKEPKITTGFGIPDGYFDGFEQKLMEQLPIREPKVISFFERNRALVMSAAAVLVVVLMVPAYTNFFETEKETIDTASMEDYLAYGSYISQYDLVNMLDLEDIQNLNIDLALEDKTIEDILTTNNNLENYIYENQ